MQIKRLLSVTVILVQLATASPVYATSDPSPAATQLSIESTWNLLKMEPPADVTGHWAERVIQWGLRNRIIEGYPDGTYQPDRIVNEAEFLLLLYRAYGARPTALQNEAWSDSPYRLSAMWRHPALGLQNAGARTAPITRGTAAEILCAALGYNYSGNDAIRYLLGIHLAEGKTSYSVEGFAAQDTVTRAEVLQWIRNLKLQGSFKMVQRPSEASDLNQIPLLKAQSTDKLMDFVVQPVSIEDFQLQTRGGGEIVPPGNRANSYRKAMGTGRGAKCFPWRYVWPA